MSHPDNHFALTLGRLALAVPLIAVSLAVSEHTVAAEGVAKYNASGELIRPTGYREWVYVGTPLTPNDMNDGRAPFPEFHAVYIDPDSWAHWKKTGKFRDGTILMKELISVGSKAATSGKGYFMGELLGLEATIKNSKQFPDEPGNWAYFSFTAGESPMMAQDKPVRGGPLKRTAAAFPTAACNACHNASAGDDWVFTQYYPVLRAAKEKVEAGTGGK